MQKDYFKYYHPKVLMGMIILGFTAITLTKESFELTISVFGVLTILITVVTRYLWKYKPFKWLFWIDDFSGRYEGQLVYKYIDAQGKEQTGELDHVKIITQSGSNIHVVSFTKKADGTLSSPSVNKGMFVENTNDNQHFTLIYSYLNDGSADQGFSPHYGTEVIKFINDGESKRLTGGYFTNRIPFQTKGEFKNLKKVSNNLTHDF